MTEERLQYYQTMLEAKLNSYLPETGPQQADVAAAMRYSLLEGGKRIRPILLLEFCRVCGGNPEKVLPFCRRMWYTPCDRGPPCPSAAAGGVRSVHAVL